MRAAFRYDAPSDPNDGPWWIDRCEPSEKNRAVLERLQANGKHLLNLINDVLDLSEIEAGELKLDVEEYSLQDVVHTVITAVEPLATGKALAPQSQTSFHHQPEAQHPKSSAIHKLAGRLPIFRG